MFFFGKGCEAPNDNGIPQTVSFETITEAFLVKDDGSLSGVFSLRRLHRTRAKKKPEDLNTIIMRRTLEAFRAKAGLPSDGTRTSVTDLTYDSAIPSGKTRIAIPTDQQEDCSVEVNDIGGVLSITYKPSTKAGANKKKIKKKKSVLARKRRELTLIEEETPEEMVGLKKEKRRFCFFWVRSKGKTLEATRKGDRQLTVEVQNDNCSKVLAVLPLVQNLPISPTLPLVAMATSMNQTSVLLFVPNLIGYGRVLAALCSFMIMSTMPDQWLLSVVLYLANFVGDLFDGLLARKLDQTSTFGGVLDMLTDRCSTLGLFMILSVEYAGSNLFRMLFLALALLDVSSHWAQTYSALAIGQHHKSEEGNEGKNFLVRWFYKYYWFFGYLCVGAEFTYVALYVRLHVQLDVLDMFLAVCVPGCVAKQFVNIAQLLSSLGAIARHDAREINARKER